MQPFSKIVRSGGAGASAIRKIMALADRKHIINLGLDPAEIISFGGGWVGHRAPEPMRRAYRAIATDKKLFHQSGAYSATAGSAEAKHAIRALNRRLYGMKLREEEIVVGQSATELTYAMLAALLDPDDRVLIFDPTYASFPVQIQTVQRHEKGIVHVRAFDPRRWTYRDERALLQDVRAALKKFRPKLILFSAPDNPTGWSFSDSFLRDMLRASQRSGTYVAMDLAYHTLYFGDARPGHVSFSPSEYENLIRIHSMSKWCRGLGRRLGWIEADERIVSAIAAIQQSVILSPDTLHQMAFASYVTEALEDGSLAKYLEETRLLYRRAARATCNAIDRHIGARYLTPTGGLYIVMDVGRLAEPFAHEVLKKTGVVVIPGGGFGPSLAKGVRISFGPLVEDPATIEKGIAKIRRFVAKKK